MAPSAKEWAHAMAFMICSPLYKKYHPDLGFFLNIHFDLLSFVSFLKAVITAALLSSVFLLENSRHSGKDGDNQVKSCGLGPCALCEPLGNLSS